MAATCTHDSLSQKQHLHKLIDTSAACKDTLTSARGKAPKQRRVFLQAIEHPYSQKDAVPVTHGVRRRFALGPDCLCVHSVIWPSTAERRWDELVATYCLGSKQAAAGLLHRPPSSGPTASRPSSAAIACTPRLAVLWRARRPLQCTKMLSPAQRLGLAGELPADCRTAGREPFTLHQLEDGSRQSYPAPICWSPAAHLHRNLRGTLSLVAAVGSEPKKIRPPLSYTRVGRAIWSRTLISATNLISSML